MRRTRLTTVLGGGAAAGLLVLTAACGSSGSSGDAGSSGGSDSQQSDSQSSDSGSGSGGSADQAATLTKDNLASSLQAAIKKAGSYAFTLKIGVSGQTVTGSGDADASTDPASAQVSIDAGGQKIQTITTDGLIYIKGGMFGSAKWIKLDPKSSTGLGALGGAGGGGDPSSQLSTLTSASKVTKGGTKSVDGVQTTEYDVTVPGSALAKSTGIPEQQKKLLPDTLRYKIYVDKDNLPRELSNDLTIQGQRVNTVIEFTDFGKKVSIQAPPASQVTTKKPGLGASSSGLG